MSQRSSAAIEMVVAGLKNVSSLQASYTLQEMRALGADLDRHTAALRPHETTLTP